MKTWFNQLRLSLFIDVWYIFILILPEMFSLFSYCVTCVSRIKFILSIIFYVIFEVCFQHTHFFFGYWENICTLSNHRPQIGNMDHYLLFGVGSLHNGTRCISSYVRKGGPIYSSITLTYGKNDTEMQNWIWYFVDAHANNSLTNAIEYGIGERNQPLWMSTMLKYGQDEQFT